MKSSPSSHAFSRNTRLAVKATPAVSPSMLSRRLKAFVTPTSQRRVSTMFIHSSGITEVRTPAERDHARRQRLARELHRHRQPGAQTSSSSPTRKHRAAPMRTAASLPATRGASRSATQRCRRGPGTRAPSRRGARK